MTALEPVSATTLELDQNGYGQLLATYRPKAIRTQSEYEAALAIVESLMEKGDQSMSREEVALLDLLVDLVSSYEANTEEPFPEATPLELLNAMMQEHELGANDLEPILGVQPAVSNILAGQVPITGDQARQLGARFHLSPLAFI